MNQLLKKTIAKLKSWIESSLLKSEPLRDLRISLGVLLTLQIICLFEDPNLFWGTTGLIQSSLKSYLSQSAFWSFHTLFQNHKSEMTVWILHLFLGAYLCFAFLLACGYFHWGLALLLNLSHYFFMNRSHLSSYGLDQFVRIGLFYILLSSFTPSLKTFAHFWQCLLVRMLQIHLALSYFIAGFEKGMGLQWWNGEAIWRALTLPRFSTFNLHWLAGFPRICTLLGIYTVVLEISFPLLISIKATKKIALLSIVFLHLNIMIFMDLKLFSLMMIALNLCAFWFPYRKSKKIIPDSIERGGVTKANKFHLGS